MNPVTTVASSASGAGRASSTQIAALRGEPARLAALRATGLLTAAGEPAFDRMTRLAVAVLGVPAAFISLVDQYRDLYVGTTGLPEPLSTTRELTGETFCHHAISGPAPLVIPDTAADPAYRDVPTARALGIAAYVGVPLVVDGQPIGSFCAIDTAPRAWTAAEVEVLTDLAESALREIAFRQANSLLEAYGRELVLANTQLRDQAEALSAAFAETDAAWQEADARRSMLAAVIDSIPDAVVVARREAVVLANAAALTVLGVSSIDALGAEHPDASPLEALLLDRTTGEPLPLEDTPIGSALRGATSHGRYLLLARGALRQPHPVRATAAPIVDADGAVTGMVAVITDMTAVQAAAFERERLLADSERARADAESARADAETARAEADTARLEAEAANRSKSAFLANMSHELRTPLNAIGGYAELMEMGIRGPVSEQQRADLARIQKSKLHLLGLINSVLDYAKVDAGAVHYESAAVSLSEVLSTCEALIAPQASAKRIALTVTVRDAGLQAQADRGKVQQILLNLLSNAVKFTDGDGHVFLTCMADDTGGEAPRVLVEVRDTGHGISAEDCERVFQPFVQVDAKLTRTQEGTGLGLAISRDLARGMGGDLTLVSTVGRGSTFTLSLPRV